MREIKLTNIFKRIIHSYQKIIKGCLDLLFPRHCFSCGKEKTRLCQDCLSQLPRSFCSGEEKIFSVFDYNSGVMKQAIWALKYKRAVDLAETFARAMSDTLLEELSEELITEAKIILIPVPLSKKRLRHRGYNQAEELAKQMVELNPEQFTLETNLIKKIKDTLTQVSLRDRAKRLANLKGAFEVADWPLASSKLDFRGLRSPTSSWAGQSSNSILIIIDDVSTTGTTIGEIHRILKDNGFYRVYGLVLAHG